MRESPKIDKTKLPIDVYEGWLKTQSTAPQERTQRKRQPVDYYEEWLGQRVRTKARTGAINYKDERE